MKRPCDDFIKKIQFKYQSIIEFNIFFEHTVYEQKNYTLSNTCDRIMN